MSGRAASWRRLWIWVAVAGAALVPPALAVASPLLAWRDPVYIAAGFAGVMALSVLLVQPLLAGGRLPGLPARRSRSIHALTGAVLVLLILIHVTGLWITSPPDVVDALLFRSPTPFSAWGVIAMWAVLASALLAAFRRRLPLRAGTWRLAHKTAGAVIVAGTVVHALQIEGTMETLSKAILCMLVVTATVTVFADRSRWRKWMQSGRHRKSHPGSRD